jgi:hypothetical protein
MREILYQASSHICKMCIRAQTFQNRNMPNHPNNSAKSNLHSSYRCITVAIHITGSVGGKKTSSAENKIKKIQYLIFGFPFPIMVAINVTEPLLHETRGNTLFLPFYLLRAHILKSRNPCRESLIFFPSLSTGCGFDIRRAQGYVGNLRNKSFLFTFVKQI